MKIDVIIPTYKPGKELTELLERLQKQTVPVHKIILMNTERSYFEPCQKSGLWEKEFPDVEVHHISKQEFDHGATRALGVSYSDAEVFVMLTQDAMPADSFLLEKLVQNLKGNVAVAYGRQLPSGNASELERASRLFNYPEQSRIKTKDDLTRLGIKTFFCSNVCAAYRRDLYEQLGGFVQKTIFNEDMIFASGVIRQGYAIAYEADAKVIHSHNFTNLQQLHRNFDLGVSQAQYGECFSGIASESEGTKLVKHTYQYLRKHKKLYQFPGFCVQCGFKYVGFLLGKKYQKLPRKSVLWLTSNKEYWRQQEDSVK